MGDEFGRWDKIILIAKIYCNEIENLKSNDEIETF